VEDLIQPCNALDTTSTTANKTTLTSGGDEEVHFYFLMM